MNEYSSLAKGLIVLVYTLLLPVALLHAIAGLSAFLLTWSDKKIIEAFNDNQD